MYKYLWTLKNHHIKGRHSMVMVLPSKAVNIE